MVQFVLLFIASSRQMNTLICGLALYLTSRVFVLSEKNNHKRRKMFPNALIDFGMTTVLEKRVRTSLIAEDYLVLNRMNIGIGTLHFDTLNSDMKCNLVGNGVDYVWYTPKNYLFLMALNEKNGNPTQSIQEQIAKITSQMETNRISMKDIELKCLLLLDTVKFNGNSTKHYHQLEYTSYMLVELTLMDGTLFYTREPNTPFSLPDSNRELDFSKRYISLGKEEADGSTTYSFENINTGRIIRSDQLHSTRVAALDLPILD